VALVSDDPTTTELLATSRPELTIAEAAEAADVNPKTIRRAIGADKFPGARQEAGKWVIPVSDLLGAGFKLHQPSPPAVPAPSADPSAFAGMEAALTAERHRAELAEQRAEKAEAIAAERERTIEAQQLALRALTAGPAQ
jgi:hypothetical protein